jgi:hypothetical protein
MPLKHKRLTQKISGAAPVRRNWQPGAKRLLRFHELTRVQTRSIRESYRRSDLRDRVRQSRLPALGPHPIGRVPPPTEMRRPRHWSSSATPRGHHASTPHVRRDRPLDRTRERLDVLRLVFMAAVIDGFAYRSPSTASAATLSRHPMGTPRVGAMDICNMLPGLEVHSISKVPNWISRGPSRLRSPCDPLYEVCDAAHSRRIAISTAVCVAAWASDRVVCASDLNTHIPADTSCVISCIAHKHQRGESIGMSRPSMFYSPHALHT